MSEIFRMDIKVINVTERCKFSFETTAAGSSLTLCSRTQVPRSFESSHQSIEKFVRVMTSRNSPDFTQKHPLEHTWSLWFDNPNG